MWPLFCNEIGLSYDQEERARSLQKQILSSSESWLNRHTATSSEYAIHSVHDAITGTTEMVQTRNRNVMNILTPAQKVQYLSWLANKKKSSDNQIINLAHEMDSKLSLKKESSELEPCKDHHDAANLYIVNHKLSTASIPRLPLLVPQASIKKLSRRPLFESLATEEEKGGKTDKKGGRKMSIDSISSMKRSSSEMSCEGLDVLQEGGVLKKSSSGHSLMACGQVQNITPEAAQAASSHIVSATLAHVRAIIPVKNEHIQDQGHLLTLQNTTSDQITPQQVQSNQTNQHNFTSTQSSGPAQLTYTLAPVQYQQPHQNNTVSFQTPDQSNVSNNGSQQASLLPATVSVSQYPKIEPNQTLSAQTPVPIAPTSMSLPNISAQGQMADETSTPDGQRYNVPSPLGLADISRENSLQGTQPEMQLILPTSYENIVSEDGSLYNVPSQMADNSLFELTEEDWAIGEGAFLD